MKGNIFYAQSGGVTPVINATAFGLIEQFFKNKKYFGKFYVWQKWNIRCLKRRSHRYII